jgi:hypothetical protein
LVLTILLFVVYKLMLVSGISSLES